ncbi:MAG: hypothetical protein P8P80_07150 [Crocinitomicaceae bacterium]|mgnify:FL=1|jgi:hypothetical protein|nr:hypothetical protein [Crocinitomicaceae bacterium]MDG1735787.1 hypothetical protein [Crocinitomicaceae bacterium]MDG2506110.1 hypothetical protein [Crocinitomicaceae bacterium]
MRNLLMVCMIVSSFPLFAQKKEHKNEKKERIEAARVSFVTKKLELTPEESQAFWPLVNEMEAEIRTSRKAIKEQFKSVKEEDAKIDDETYKSLLEDMHDQHFLMVKIKNDYSKKIGAIIGYEKAFKFEVEVQKEFKKQLMDRMKRGHEKGATPQNTTRQKNK